MNSSAALDIRPHWRYVVEKVVTGFSRLLPRMIFDLFAPQMVFTRNLGLTRWRRSLCAFRRGWHCSPYGVVVQTLRSTWGYDYGLNGNVRNDVGNCLFPLSS